jgi:hypothetical protein
VKGVTQLEIRDASLPAFRVMIRYIYTEDREMVDGLFPDYDLLFQLFGLADKYLLAELKETVRYCFEMSFFDAEQYANIFRVTAAYQNLLGYEQLCETLRDNCALNVKSEWKSLEDNVSFWATDYNDDPDLKRTLMLRIADISAKKCPVCNRPNPKCLEGVRLTYKNCEAGMVVRAKADLRSVSGVIIQAGNRGAVREHSSHRSRMCTLDRNDDTETWHYDDETCDYEEGVLSVKWNKTKLRTIHDNMQDIEIIVCHSDIGVPA